jgi:porphobilinogen synthase
MASKTTICCTVLSVRSNGRCLNLVVITDVALDPYTSHGHDGVLAADVSVDNDETVAILSSPSF